MARGTILVCKFNNKFLRLLSILVGLALAVRGDGSNGQSIAVSVATGTRVALQAHHLPIHLSLNSSLSSPSSPSRVLFHLKENCSICTSSGRVAGHFEDSRGAPLLSFSLQKVKDGDVFLQHYLVAGLEPVNVSLIVATPTSLINQSLVIRVVSFNGNITFLGHPRALVRVGRAISISTRWLRLATNFETQDPELVYHMRSVPKRGVLELLESNSWKRLNVDDNFTQWQVNELRLRYRQNEEISVDDAPLLTDLMSFSVSSSQLQGPVVSLTVFIMSESFSFSPSITTNTTSLSVTEGNVTLFGRDTLFFSFSPPSIVYGSLSYPLSHNDFNISLAILSLPSNGRLLLGTGPTERILSVNSVISYVDFLDQKLTYVHGGSDTLSDSVLILVNVTSNVFDISNASRISVDIEITPVNDNAPRLRQFHDINPLEGSFIFLNQSFFEITDRDQISFDYVISVSGGTGGKGMGHFAEVSKGLDEEITKFTMNQVIRREIVYVYRHLDPSQRLSYYHNVLISDGLHTVQETLNVSVIPLHISVATNPSNADPHCLDVLIDIHFFLNSNMFVINTTFPERLSEITVSVATPPSWGHLTEGLDPVSSFSYSSIDYIEYKLDDSLSQVHNDTLYLQFAIGHGQSQLVRVDVCIIPYPHPFFVNHTSFTVLATSQYFITSSNLYVSQSRFDFPGAIKYTLIRSERNHEKLSPLYGSIRNAKNNEIMTEFTQQDINDRNVVYVSSDSHPTSTEFEDEIYFIVQNDFYILPKKYMIKAIITQNILNVTNNGFSVTEAPGQEHVITRDDLYIEPLEGYHTKVYIQQDPQHGDLVLRRPEPAPEVRHPQHFDLDDITNGYVSYKFKAPTTEEEEEDVFYFYFVLRNLSNDKDYKTFRGVMKIDIELINDNAPVCYAPNNLIVPEGCDRPITRDIIHCHDSDLPFDPRNLTISIIYHFDYNGDICRGNQCSIRQWSWDDVLSNRLTYKAGNKSGDSYFVIEAFDENKKSEVMLVKVIVQETVAYWNATKSLSVVENSKSVVGPDIISFTTDCSRDISPSEIKYNITVVPSYGKILDSDGNELKEFTQEDINSGGVVYQQDGSNEIEDSFELDVRIRSFNSSNVSINISISPVDDDPPVLDVTRILFCGYGTVAFFNNTILSMKDPDTYNTSKLTYYMVESLAGKIGVGKKDNATSFTQQDIDKGIVKYTHDLLTKWSDWLVLQVSDGTNDQTETYSLHVIIVPQDNIIPTTPSSASVMEGGNVTLDPSSIIVNHPYFNNTSGNVTVIEGVTNGILSLNGTKCGRDCKFSLDMLESEYLTYYHDGSETRHDNFSFRIQWGPFQTTVTPYLFNIEPVDDERPRIINNTLLRVFTLKTAIVTSAELAAVDPDTPPHLLRYTFTSRKLHGYFIVNGTQNDSFTQADINEGRVLFADRHDYEGFDFDFHFVVSDGFHELSGVFTTHPIIVSIAILRNITAVVPMGGTVVIDNGILLADINNDIDSNSIQYILAGPTSDIKYGQLGLASSSISVSSFNQSQVSSGSILYQHTALEVWEPMEVIQLTVYHPLAKENRTISLSIKVNLPSSPHSSLAVKKELRLKENEVKCFNQSLLDASNIRYKAWKKTMTAFLSYHEFLQYVLIFYDIIQQPKYGSLILDGNDTKSSTVSNFTQSDIANGLICYNNDGSEYNNDSFIVQVKISTPSGTVIKTTPPETINIAIELYNDEFPYLDQSLSLNKSFVKGFSEVFTASDLLVTDKDDGPKSIMYSITGLTSGEIILNSSIPVTQFTQEDINAGQLAYRPGDTGRESFQFSFVDSAGHRSGQNYTFYLNVLPFLFDISSHGLEISQSETSALITSKELNATTNRDRLATRFKIIDFPEYGEVQVLGRVSSEFSQDDIDNGQVQYRLYGTSHHRDLMTIRATNNDNDIDFNMSIRVVLDGSVNNDIVLNFTDTPSLPLPPSLLHIKLLSSGLIHINFTSKLRYGYLSRRFNHGLGMGKRKTNFLYEDLKSNNIYYNWSPDSGISHNNITYIERISGVVTAEGVSPGEFHLTLTLIPNYTPTTSSTAVTPVSSVSTPTGGTVEAAFYVPLSALVLVVLILLMIVVIFCACQSRIIKIKLAKGLSGGSVGKGGFLPPPSSLSYKVAEPKHHSTMSPHFSRGEEEVEQDVASDTLSSISGADIMMVRHPVSTSHTHLPYQQDLGAGYHSHSVDEAIGRGYMDDMNPGIQHGHLETPPFFPGPHADQFRVEPAPRSRSPVRRPSSLRQNPRPYSSRTSLGRVSPVKPPHYHTPLNFSRPESASSIGYDSSCMTEESVRHSRPSSVNTSLRVDEVCNSQYEDSTRCTTPAHTTTARPALKLKEPQYWV